jgi:hypothetical protein
VCVLVSLLWEDTRCGNVGVACKCPRCGWLVWVRVLSLQVVVGDEFVWLFLTVAISSCSGLGCLLEVGSRSLNKESAVCFCVVMGVWGVGSCPVPVLVRYGVLVVGKDGTCGALCCSCSGGSVPVSYRYCIVRSGGV